MGYLFLLPSLIGVGMFLVFPMADTVRRSFVTVSGQWNGLNNYRTVLANASFRLAAWNTIRFLITAVPLLLLLSLGAALAVRRTPAFVKSSFLVPLALPVASFALIWRVLFDAHGLINSILVRFGVESVPFMNSGASFWVLVDSYIWKNLGFDILAHFHFLTFFCQVVFSTLCLYYTVWGVQLVGQALFFSLSLSMLTTSSLASRLG